LDKELRNRLTVNLRQHLARSGEALFSHQQQALQRIATFLTQPVGSPIDDESLGLKRGDWCEIISATGTGKTRMFGHLAQGMGQRTLILTPRNLLNSQTKREFCEEIGISPDDVGVYDSKQTQRQKQLALDKPYLITTYQSLPALVKKGLLSPDPAKPTHRPVVILDEAHTGQGHVTAKLIRSFLDTCFVAGFTATDAGVHESLFNGQRSVFELGIVPAIEQGLLCQGVKTGVLDVQIDEDWLRQFKKTARGEYADEDVHRFARNPSVVKGAIEFHLTQDDEQLGKLHRLPTIFFTHGVDAAQLGAELFNQRAAELGIDVRADFISGDMDQKEREEKLERFKRGEIQALWNDRVLEMGFDDSSATVCYSLKPSLMSATPTQQMGRVTRRSKPDYASRFGQEKIALAINVRAPGMNPFLFGEVLGGRPAVFSTLRPPSQGKSEHPKVTKLPIADVTVHLDYADMETVLSQATLQRQEWPAKTDEWKRKDEFAREIGTTIQNPACRELWNRIAREYVRSPTQPVIIDGHPVRCGNRQSSRQAVFCVHTSEVEWFEAKLGLATGTKTEEWRHYDEFARLVRVNRRNEAYNGLWNRIESEFRAAPDRSVVIEGHTVRCGIRKGARHLFCLHVDEAAWFNTMIGRTEVKTDDWLAKEDVARALKTESRREDFQSLWVKLEQACDANPDAPVLGDHTVMCGRKMAGNRMKAFCVHRSELPWMAQQLGKDLANRTDDWLRRDQFASYIHVSKSSPEFNALWDRIEATLASPSAEPVTLDGHPLKARRMQSRNHQSVYVHVSEADWFRQRLGKNLPVKTDGWLPRDDFARHMQVSPRNRAFNALWDQIEAALLAAPEETVTIRGHRLQAQRMQSGVRQPLCMHISEKDWFRHELEERASSMSGEVAAEPGHQTWAEEVGHHGQKCINTRPINPDSERPPDRPDEPRSR
jgi:superfamily II DNA or RNA helicase